MASEIGSRELKVGLMLVAIFATGVLSGVLLDRKLAARGPPAASNIEADREAGNERQRGPVPLIYGREAPVLAEMTTRMKLTPEQQKRVSEILSAWAAQVKQSRQDSIKQRMELFEKTMPVIRTNLTPEQLHAYDEMVERTRRKQRQLQNRSN